MLLFPLFFSRACGTLSPILVSYTSKGLPPRVNRETTLVCVRRTEVTILNSFARLRNTFLKDETNDINILVRFKYIF